MENRNYDYYELVTPSDTVTFAANDDLIAYAVTLIVGQGKAGITKLTDKNLDNQENFPYQPFIAFMNKHHSDMIIQDAFGCKLEEYVEDIEVRKKIAECMNSFAYGDLESRIVFDEAMEAIDDPAKREKFRKGHEDRNRTSMSQIVKGAWDYAEQLKGYIELEMKIKAEK